MGELIARTGEQESCSDAGVYWWKEYRVRHVTEKEYWRSPLDCPYRPWLLEVRYLCRLPGSGKVIAKFEQGRLTDAIVNPIEPQYAWTPWWMDESPRACILEILGDGSFVGAESLCPEHAACVLAVKAMGEANAALHESKKRYDGARKDYDEFKRDENRLFGKRHGLKTGDELKKWEERTIKRLAPQIESHKIRVRESRERFEQAQAAQKQAAAAYAAFKAAPTIADVAIAV